MDKYDEIFLEQAKIGYNNFNKQYHHFSDKSNLLRQRKIQLNNQFEFTEKNVKRINEINQILRQKTESAFDNAEYLENSILDLIKGARPFISDYEIEFKLSLFSPQKYSKIEDLDGNPFFEYNPILGFNKSVDSPGLIEIKKNIDLLQTNFNEFQFSEHPLKEQNHCYLLHDLYDHTILSWQDIVDLEEIWFEVILTLQNITVSI